MDRFWSKVNKAGDNDCWEWQASLRNGYGAFKFRGKMWIASRVAYTLTKGEIPNGLLVCHTCDNRKCVNPAHLFLGTYVDNAQDMIAKGRQYMPPTKDMLPPPPHPSHRAYNDGCRCRPCVDLSNSRKKKWRERTGKN